MCSTQFFVILKFEFNDHVDNNLHSRYHANRQSKYINKTKLFPFHQIPPGNILNDF